MQKQPGGAPAPAAPPVTGETRPVPAQQPPVKAKPAEPVTPAPSTSLFDNPMLIAALGGAALLLLIVAWRAARRRREGDDGEEARFEPIVAQAAAEAAALKQSRHAAASPIADDMAPTAQMNTVAEEVARAADGAAVVTASDLDMMRTAEGDIDPIVEADVYLAYRRYQQAEALIQNALAKEPDRLELKLKLLEIYYAARNAESFQATAEALHNELWQHPDDALRQRVVAMGAELLPGHVLFTNAAPVEAPPVGGVGAALFAAGDHPIDVPQAEMAPAADDDFLGFDSKAAAPAGGEQSLELDLNVAADAHGLEEMAGGAKDELVSALDLPGTQPGSAVSRAPIADNSRWNTEPALSDFGNMDFNLDDADFLAGTDVVGTKLDLARAYIDMGDHDSARDILKEVMSEGNPQQKQEAQTLSQQLACARYGASFFSVHYVPCLTIGRHAPRHPSRMLHDVEPCARRRRLAASAARCAGGGGVVCARGRGGMGDDHAEDAPHALAVVVPRGDLFLVHAGRGRRARAGCVGGVGADGGRPRTGRLAYRRARLDGGDGGAAAAFHAPRATLRRAALVDRAAGPVRRVARTRGGAGGLDARRGRGGAKRSARDGAARGTATHAVDALG